MWVTDSKERHEIGNYLFTALCGLLDIAEVSKRGRKVHCANEHIVVLRSQLLAKPFGCDLK